MGEYRGKTHAVQHTWSTHEPGNRFPTDGGQVLSLLVRTIVTDVTTPTQSTAFGRIYNAM